MTLFYLFATLLSAGQFPVYEIPFSGVSRDNFIEGSIAGKLAQSALYASLTPKPFVYATDFKNDGDAAFVVAGVNPSSRLRKLRSLTGLSMDRVDGRMVASNAKLLKRDLAHVEKSWTGIGNVGIRRSNDGFLSSGEKFLERLMADNDLVLGQKLTHQKVAEPLMKAIGTFEAAQADGTFEYGGKKYAIKAGKMAGDSFLFDLLKKSDIRRTSRSGWIGFGMQGSPFNDELFANWYFEITPATGGKGIRGDALTSQLIYRYGFYQGGKYRMDPSAIIRFFEIKSAT